MKAKETKAWWIVDPEGRLVRNSMTYGGGKRFCISNFLDDVYYTGNSQERRLSGKPIWKTWTSKGYTCQLITLKASNKSSVNPD